MLIEIIGSSTHIDAHGMRMTKKALENAADSINNGTTTPGVGVNHDITIPPIGKVLKASVEPMEDGEFKLVMTQDIFERCLQISLSDGTELIEAGSSVDNRPFADMETEPPGKIRISYDPINFQPKDALSRFQEEIRSIGDFEETALLRKAYISDPELIITLTKSLIVYLAGRKLIDKVSDKVGDKVAEDLTNLYSLTKTGFAAMIKYAIPKNRPITYVYRAPGLPLIELVVRTNNPDIAISAVLEDKIVPVFKNAKELHNKFNATKIQMLFSQDKWIFNYLLTQDGRVIGTPISFERGAKEIELMGKRSENF